MNFKPGVVAVAGEVIMDIVSTDQGEEAVAGGSPANVAVGLQRLGVPARLLARLSTDEYGRQLRRSLISNGVDVSHSIDADQAASVARVRLAADGGATYDFHVDGTADWQWRSGELTNALEGEVVALHVGSLAMTQAPGADALLELALRARTTCTVTYDPNCRPLIMGNPEAVRDRIMAAVTSADVVKVSTEDLEWFLPGREPIDVAREWHMLGASLVVVTRGPDGAIAVFGNDAVDVPGQPADVVDTVGAGDSFMSALIWGLCQRDLLGAHRRAALGKLDSAEVTALVRTAVAASAITCGRRGADPPTLADLQNAAA